MASYAAHANNTADSICTYILVVVCSTVYSVYSMTCMWTILSAFEVCLTCTNTAAAAAVDMRSMSMNYSPCFYSESHATIRFDSTPTLRELDTVIVDEVASSWDRMALHLGVQPSCIAIVKRDHPSDCVGACRDAMGKWLQGYPNTGNENRTWHTVHNALQTSGYRRQAELLRAQMRDVPEAPGALSVSEPSEELVPYRPRFDSVPRPLNGKHNYTHIYNITLL